MAVLARLLAPRPQAAAAPARRPGVLRRERRASSHAREEKLRDLGGLMLEMYRRDQFREDLLAERCNELLGLEGGSHELDELLAAARRRSPGRPLRVRRAASLGSHFCPNCGRPAGEPAGVACPSAGTRCRRTRASCASCGAASEADAGSTAGAAAEPARRARAPPERLPALRRAARAGPGVLPRVRRARSPRRRAVSAVGTPGGAARPVSRRLDLGVACPPRVAAGSATAGIAPDATSARTGRETIVATSPVVTAAVDAAGRSRRPVATTAPRAPQPEPKPPGRSTGRRETATRSSSRRSRPRGKRPRRGHAGGRQALATGLRSRRARLRRLPSLHPGYYVVFSGVFDSLEEAADGALSRCRRGFQARTHAQIAR